MLADSGIRGRGRPRHTDHFHVYFPHRCLLSTTVLSNALSVGRRMLQSKCKERMRLRVIPTPNFAAWQSRLASGWLAMECLRARESPFLPTIIRDGWRHIWELLQLAERPFLSTPPITRIRWRSF